MKMSNEEVRRFLEEPRIARTASNSPNDARMSFLIDDDHYPYRQVTIQGLWEVEESESKAAEYIERICVRYLGPDAGLRYSESLKQSINAVLVKVEVSKLFSWNYYTGGYRTKA